MLGPALHMIDRYGMMAALRGGGTLERGAGERGAERGGEKKKKKNRSKKRKGE
jgi:hypothetical protein